MDCTLVTSTCWNSRCVVFGVLAGVVVSDSGLFVSNGSKLRYTPTVSPALMVPPTARSAVSVAEIVTLSAGMLVSAWRRDGP